MEVQLEEEYDDKQKVLKERRELEAKLCSAKEEVNRRTPSPPALCLHLHLQHSAYTFTSSALPTPSPPALCLHLHLQRSAYTFTSSSEGAMTNRHSVDYLYKVTYLIVWVPATIWKNGTH